MRNLGKNLLNLAPLVMLCVICLSTTVSASEVRPFVLMGSASGGDVLHNGEFSDLDAGGLFYFGGGVLYEPENSDFMYQTSLGYKVGGANYIFFDVDTSGKERTKIMRVLPLDVVAFFKVKNLRLGLGLAYFIGPEYKRCSSKSGCSTLNFDDALGSLAEVRYQFQGGALIGLRHTWVDYESSSRTVDASNVRIHFGYAF